MANTKVFDNDVVECENPETGEYKVETDSTILVDRGEELQKIEGDTKVYLEQGTHIYVPNDGETQVYDPDKPEETKIWDPDDPEETKIWDKPKDEVNETEVYEPPTDTNQTDWPTPNFPNPETNTIKENYDWMFQKGLKAGHSPEESAKAASEMAMTMADVVDQLE